MQVFNYLCSFKSLSSYWVQSEAWRLCYPGCWVLNFVVKITHVMYHRRLKKYHTPLHNMYVQLHCIHCTNRFTDSSTETSGIGLCLPSGKFLVRKGWDTRYGQHTTA